MSDFKNMSDKYRQQMLDLYNKNPKDIPVIPNTPNTIQEPTPIDSDCNDYDKPIEEKYPEPILPPFIYEDTKPQPQEPLTQFGYLKVIATSAEGTIPLDDVSVIVSKTIDDHDEIFYTLLTDASGETTVVELPTPNKSLSESPNTTNTKPFAEYNISTYLHGYFQVTNTKVPIFSGVTSIQRVNMIPLPSYTDERKVINITLQDTEPNL